MHKLGQGLALAAMIALVGCTAKSPVLSNPNPTTSGTTATGTSTTTVQVAPPVVSSFSPKSGGAGTVVTIVGSGFDASAPTNNTVLFNGVPGVVNSATSTTLTATVPPGASFGTLTVIVDGRTAVSADTYSPNWKLSTVAGTVAPQGIPARVWAASYETLALDSHGNMYATTDGTVLYKITPDGTLTTLAGNGESGNSGDGGPATQARLTGVMGVAVDPAGNVYLSDYNDNVVRKVDTSGIISTVAGLGRGGYSGDGGPATNAMLNNPAGLVLDAAGDLFIADSSNNVVRKVDTHGTITTVAGIGSAGYLGDGSAAASASLNAPFGLVMDATGDLFIADANNNVVREINASTGNIATIAGNGSAGYSGDSGLAASASLNVPQGLAMDTSGDLFIADYSNYVIRKVDTQGNISTVAGNNTYGFSGDNGAATSAQLNSPAGVAVDGAGDLLIADYGNDRIRKVDTHGTITTFAGAVTSTQPNGPALGVQFPGTNAMAEDGQGALYIADTNNSAVYKVSNGNVSTIAGNGTYGYSGDGGAATSAELYYPQGVTADPTGDVFIADTSNNRIRRVDAQSGVITTVVGNGTAGFSGDGSAAASASLSGPQSVAMDATGDLIIADRYNYRIREVNAKTGVITSLAGNGVSGYYGDGGQAVNAELVNPLAVTVDTVGNVYVLDSTRVRKIDTHGVITTVGGNGYSSYKFLGFTLGQASSYTFKRPSGLAVDPAGNVYVSDRSTGKIYRISAADGTIDAIAGDGSVRLGDDDSIAAQSGVGTPGALLWSGFTGHLLFADTYHSLIRAIGY